MKKAAGCFVLLFGCVTGCAPASVLQITSQDPISRWREERRIEQRTDGGVGVAASFVRDWGEHLVFMVTVANGSDSPVLVDPEEFYFTLADSTRTLPAESAPGYAARGPDEFVTWLNRSAARRQLNSDLAVLAIVAGAAIVVASLLASSHEEPDPCGCCDEAGDDDRRGDPEPAAAPQRAGLDGLARSREEWIAHALRRSTLEPWKTASGLVAFPAAPVRKHLEGVRHAPAASLAAPGRATKECTLFLHGPLEARSPAIAFRVRRL